MSSLSPPNASESVSGLVKQGSRELRDELANRALDTIYTNTKLVPILLSINAKSTNSTTFNYLVIEVDSVAVAKQKISDHVDTVYDGAQNQLTIMVPSGSTYKAALTTSGTLNHWLEYTL